MKTYENKEELKAEIKRAYDKYIAEFKDIPESLKDKQCMEVDRTPAENLAYQVGWTALVLKWENDEQAGLPVKTPSDGFKWNQLGELYQWFTDTYAHLSLKELMGMLDDNIQKIFTMIDSMTEEELFLLRRTRLHSSVSIGLLPSRILSSRLPLSLRNFCKTSDRISVNIHSSVCSGTGSASSCCFTPGRSRHFMPL